MSELDEENLEINDGMICYACGEEMNARFSAMLICAECLNDECDEFMKEASKPKKASKKK